MLLKNFLHNGSNALIRKKVINEIGCFDPELKVVEDWDFYLRIAAKYNFVLVPKVQINYRQSASSMTGNIKRMEYYLNYQETQQCFPCKPVYHQGNICDRL